MRSNGHRRDHDDPPHPRAEHRPAAPRRHPATPPIHRSPSRDAARRTRRPHEAPTTASRRPIPGAWQPEAGSRRRRDRGQVTPTGAPPRRCAVAPPTSDETRNRPCPATDRPCADVHRYPTGGARRNALGPPTRHDHPNPRGRHPAARPTTDALRHCGGGQNPNGRPHTRRTAGARHPQGALPTARGQASLPTARAPGHPPTARDPSVPRPPAPSGRTTTRSGPTAGRCAGRSPRPCLRSARGDHLGRTGRRRLSTAAARHHPGVPRRPRHGCATAHRHGPARARPGSCPDRRPRRRTDATNPSRSNLRARHAVPGARAGPILTGVHRPGPVPAEGARARDRCSCMSLLVAHDGLIVSSRPGRALLGDRLALVPPATVTPRHSRRVSITQESGLHLHAAVDDARLGPPSPPAGHVEGAPPDRAADISALASRAPRPKPADLRTCPACSGGRARRRRRHGARPAPGRRREVRRRARDVRRIARWSNQAADDLRK